MVRAGGVIFLIQQHLQAMVTVLALVNPLMCGALFARIEDQQTRQTQLADATRAALAVLVILVLAAFFGIRILHLFGVSLDAFSVAGGGVLAWIGFSMLAGDAKSEKAAATGDTHGDTTDGKTGSRSLTPLIIFAASPGTITGVITLSVAHGRSEFPVTALLAVAVAVLAMWIVIVLVARMGGRTGGAGSAGFARDTVSRFMGLIVIAMGIQFALTGLRSFMFGSQ